MLLVVIHEKFFKGDGSLEGHKCHEIVFYFLMKPRGIMTLESNSYTQGVKEEMDECRKRGLNQVDLFHSKIREDYWVQKRGLEKDHDFITDISGWRTYYQMLKKRMYHNRKL